MALLTKSRIRSRVQSALQQGLTRAYENVKVDPQHYLQKLQLAHGLPIRSFRDMHSVPLQTIDDIAAQTVRTGMKFAIVEGAGLGIGGFLTVVPDFSFLAGITMRTIQKLSLLYGFEYNTDEEIADLWVAVAFAAGIDITRDLVEKHLISKFVPRVIQSIAVQASKEAAEKWAARAIPVLSAAIGAGLNYFFVRAWGRRAARHFRDKHVVVRQMMAERV